VVSIRELLEKNPHPMLRPLECASEETGLAPLGPHDVHVVRDVLILLRTQLHATHCLGTLHARSGACSSWAPLCAFPFKLFDTSLVTTDSKAKEEEAKSAEMLVSASDRNAGSQRWWSCSDQYAIGTQDWSTAPRYKPGLRSLRRFL